MESPKSQVSESLDESRPRTQGNPEHLVEIDNSNDSDSAYGDDEYNLALIRKFLDLTTALRSTFTASITSSILQYRLENGRQYHAYKDGSYLFPNDETENDRLDIQHAQFLQSLGGKLHFAPLPKQIPHVLDIGTGTGIWALDFADEHPESEIIGTDLSPIQPSFVPPNLKFLIDDAEAEWAFPHQFDYIHCRMLTGAVQDWDNLYRQCYENTRPGGYIEMQDIMQPLGCDDDTMPPSSSLYQWGHYIVDAFQALNRPIDVAKHHKRRMEEAGFIEVTETLHKWPQNQWAKDPNMKKLGAYTMVNMLQGVSGLSMAAFTRGLGWTQEEVEVFLVGVRNDVKNRGIHCYWPIYFVHGKKPESSQ